MDVRRANAARWVVLGLALSVLVLTACAPAVALPPASASPQVVLDTYLRALAAGDCSTGRKLWTEGAASRVRGDLCGETQVSAYGITGDPAQPTADELVFSTILTTTGTRDGSVRAGRITRFFTLRRQANGVWRIWGGGSGP
jgi:hypothetical protein